MNINFLSNKTVFRPFLNVFIVLLVMFLLSSCLANKKPTDNASYKLTDVSVRLIFKYNTDSIFTEEARWQLVNKSIPLFETTYSIKDSVKMGISIRLLADKIVHEKQSYFYGHYPIHPLEDKILQIQLNFENEDSTLSIADSVQGDRSMNAFLWKKHDRKNEFKTYYMVGSRGGYEIPYFKKTNDLIETLNNTTDLKEIDHYDFIFWIGNDMVNNLKKIQPKRLSLNFKMINKEGVQYTLSDKIDIFNSN